MLAAPTLKRTRSPTELPPAKRHAGSYGCRLLWRGNLVHRGLVLPGIAIVAHLFAVPALLSPQLSSQPSPFDDPFSPSSSQGADVCLALEMLRSADIQLLEPQHITHASLSVSEAKSDAVAVETATDVRVYVDERCQASMQWFERAFCAEGRAGIGMRLEVGGEEFLIFAAYPDAQPGTSDTRPALKLLLGRVSRLSARKPRPDDPMPRGTPSSPVNALTVPESLFANKLRRTTSLPVLTFNPPKPKARSGLSKTASSSALFDADPPAPTKTKPKSKARDSKVLLGLLAGEKRDVKGKGKEIAGARGASETNARRRPSPAPGAGTPGRRGKKRALGKSSSEIVRDEMDEFAAGTDDPGFDYMPGSPTPSVTGTVHEDEEDDVVTELPQFNLGARASTSTGQLADEERKGIQRSTSAPAGLLFKDAARLSKEGSSKAGRSSSAGVEGIESKNKAVRLAPINRRVLTAATDAPQAGPFRDNKRWRHAERHGLQRHLLDHAQRHPVCPGTCRAPMLRS